ncbi:attachment protein [Pseudomonas aeruginosa]|uniref:attachment protein n=1 Tax=Pseudomonas aeruginosa TaxID=287 RepID=UPI002F403B7F
MWGLTMKFASLILMLLFATLARAEDYYWKIQSLPERFSSPSAACAAWAKATGRPGEFTFTGSMKARDQTSFWCEFTNNETGKTAAGYGPAGRYGDSCPEGTEYDKATGICKSPPQECKEGELFPAKGPDSPVVTSGGRNYVGDGGAPTACYQSCEYGGNPSPASCYLVKGSTTTGFCNYILKGTGQNCGADSYTFAQTGDSLNPPDTPNTDPSDPNDPGCPPGWSWSGTTCVKTPTDPTDPTDPTTPGGDGSGTGGDGNGTCDPAKENCSTGPEGPGGELKEPTPGTWDDAIATWEKKVEDAKQELKTKVKANVDQMKGAFDLNLAEGGGQLPCESMTIWGKSYSLCISDYAGQLSSLRVALLLMAALIAALILLKD